MWDRLMSKVLMYTMTALACVMFVIVLAVIFVPSIVIWLIVDSFFARIMPAYAYYATHVSIGLSMFAGLWLSAVEWLKIRRLKNSH